MSRKSISGWAGAFRWCAGACAPKCPLTVGPQNRRPKTHFPPFPWKFPFNWKRSLVFSTAKCNYHPNIPDKNTVFTRWMNVQRNENFFEKNQRKRKTNKTKYAHLFDFCLQCFLFFYMHIYIIPFKLLLFIWNFAWFFFLHFVWLNWFMFPCTFIYYFFFWFLIKCIVLVWFDVRWLWFADLRFVHTSIQTKTLHWLENIFF